jgi:hypothetical protein
MEWVVEDRHIIANLTKYKQIHIKFKRERNTGEKLLYIQYRNAEVANGSQLFALLKKHDIFLSSVETAFYVNCLFHSNTRIFFPKLLQSTRQSSNFHFF